MIQTLIKKKPKKKGTIKVPFFIISNLLMLF